MQWRKSQQLINKSVIEEKNQKKDQGAS